MATELAKELSIGANMGGAIEHTTIIRTNCLQFGPIADRPPGRPSRRRVNDQHFLVLFHQKKIYTAVRLFFGTFFLKKFYTASRSEVLTPVLDTFLKVSSNKYVKFIKLFQSLPPEAQFQHRFNNMGDNIVDNNDLKEKCERILRDENEE